MNTYWLSLTLTVVFPGLPLLNAIFLLRRAVRPAQAHWFAFAASGMVFALCGLWLSNSVRQLLTLVAGQADDKLVSWVMLNMRAGPGLALSMLLLSGGFWAWLAWQQRKLPKK